MDPSRNNLPLQFNNKNQAQAPPNNTRINNNKDKYDNRKGPGMNNEGGDGLMGMPNNMMTGSNMMMMNPMMQGQIIGPGAGMLGPMPQNMIGPQGLMGPGHQGMIGQVGPGGPPMMGPGMSMGPPVKEKIVLKSCILYPPTPGTMPRGTRDKPPGCRTIFVGGLPDNTTEDILEEIFMNCGPIHRIRISKKKFSHIRFQNVESVEESLYISGYKMKINDSDAPEDTGRIHVDYAEAREDQHDFECMQRAMAREMRHLQRMEEARHRPPSPPPIVKFSEHEASALLEEMKVEENFTQASSLLIAWLERGECNRRTVHTFYSLVQNSQGNMRRLTIETQNLGIEFEQYKMQHKQKLQAIISQIRQVEKILESAQKQRNWDQFSKAQRKSILAWQSQAKSLRQSHEDDVFKDDQVGINDDMEFSDEDVDEPSSSTSCKKRKSDIDDDKTESEKMKRENTELKSRMEDAWSEAESARKSGEEELEQKEKQISVLQTALQGMQSQLTKETDNVKILTREKDELSARLKVTQSKLTTAQMEATVAQAVGNAKSSKMLGQSEREEVVVSSSGVSISNKEAKMIGLISCFLHVHPHGATLDYLWSYLNQLMTVRVRDVEDLMEKIPTLFQQKISGVGASIERKWVFTALSDTSD